MNRHAVAIDNDIGTELEKTKEFISALEKIRNVTSSNITNFKSIVEGINLLKSQLTPEAIKLLNQPENKAVKDSFEKKGDSIIAAFKKIADDTSCNINTLGVLSAHIANQVKLPYNQLSLFQNCLETIIGLNSNKKVGIFELVEKIPQLSVFVKPSPSNIQPLLAEFVKNLDGAVKVLKEHKAGLESTIYVSNIVADVALNIEFCNVHP